MLKIMALSAIIYIILFFNLNYHVVHVYNRCNGRVPVHERISYSSDFLTSIKTNSLYGGLNCWPREKFTHTMTVLTEPRNI